VRESRNYGAPCNGQICYGPCRHPVYEGVLIMRARVAHSLVQLLHEVLAHLLVAFKKLEQREEGEVHHGQ
jgi:hypothetical protein